ncbi:hypothetical protein PENTCL1PPCAC_13762, partial [Pristionchus entomophagus]
RSETMSLMEKQLQEFSIIHESIKASNSLQSKVDELSTMNERLEKELDEARSQLMSLKTISDSIQSDVRQEAIDEIRKKDAIISSLSLQVISLEQARQHAPSQPQQQEDTQKSNLDDREKLRQEHLQQLEQERQQFVKRRQEEQQKLNDEKLER